MVRMSYEEKYLLKFGPYHIDPSQRVLFCGDRVIPLAPKVFDTLLVLVQSKGRILEKEEGLARVWPDTFVEEGSLARNVSTLRKVLGENPDDQTYIQTVPKRGYRFVATVSSVPAAAQVRLDAGGKRHVEGDSLAAHAKSRRWISVSVAGAVVITAIAGWFAWSRPTRELARSVVVLPFVNLSADPGREYFSDGLTEEIIHALTHIPGLRVVARTSAFQFKAKSADVRTIGATLGVDAVLEGSVRIDGDRLRVTAQLNDARDGYHYWSHSWNHGMKDVFAVQQQVAQEVVEALGRKSRLPAAKPLTTNPVAYDYYLQGVFFQQRITAGRLAEALEAFRKALIAEPGFAAAYGQIAQSYSSAQQVGLMPAQEAFALAGRHTRKALELDPDLAMAHAVQAEISFFQDWNWEAAEASFRRAIDANPSDEGSHHDYAHFLVAMGRFDEALRETDRLISIDPRSFNALNHAQFHFLMTGDLPRSLAMAQRALAIDPEGADAFMYLQSAYEQSGQLDKAIEAFARRSNAKQDLIAAVRKGLHDGGASGYWQAWYDDASRHVPMDEGARARRLATYCSRLGRKDEALRWLEKAVQLRDSGMVYLNVSPAFAPIRQDPGFRKLVRRVGLPPSTEK